MRAVDCACGQHLEGDDDDALVRLANQHASESHPEEPTYSELDMMAMVEREGYEVPSG